MYKRTIELDRASIDPDAGTVRAVLFTDGEASDGHILDMAGGVMPDQIPMFVNHQADPRTQLGSITPDGGTEHEKRVLLHFFLDGEGVEADIRRDIFAKMQAGHVSRLSGKWHTNGTPPVERAKLPKDHPAYVPNDTRGVKRYGMYFESWRAMEGSVVGLNADPGATMRWAEEAGTPEVAAFWRGQAAEAEAAGDELERAVVDALGADLRRELVDQLVPIIERLDALEALATEPPAREETKREAGKPAIKAVPLPAMTPSFLARVLEDELQKARKEVIEEQRRMLDKRRGKVG